MTDDEDIDVTIDFTVRYSDNGRVTLREIALGLAPVILIEPELTEDAIVFKVDATDIELEEMADLFEVMAENIRANLDDVVVHSVD